ncbi:hypothetical protein OIU84_009877 [Salix udensis]|uniref:RDRP C-terminal head domain-containing protein n=1 Tax=Salix udensis TaxID=889485 RepID=A0AAD6JJI6_9ROSI|nr:hypothetical protein OIU84_009877 [Salix udensis]
MDVDFAQLDDDEKSMLYERKASAWYQVAYHPQWVQKSRELQDSDGAGISVTLSFAWIAADYLARIKIWHSRIGNVDPAKPVNSLAKYLADRMTASGLNGTCFNQKPETAQQYKMKEGSISFSFRDIRVCMVVALLYPLRDMEQKRILIKWSVCSVASCPESGLITCT